MDDLALIWCLRFAWLFLVLSAGYLLKCINAPEKRFPTTAGELLRWRQEHPRHLNGSLSSRRLPAAVRRVLVFIAALWLLSPIWAKAAVYTGGDALANAAWNDETCSRFLSIVSNAKRPAMTILWDSSFGTSLKCPVRFLDKFKDRDHLLKIVFSNETCRRNRNCETGDFFKQLSVSQYNQLLESKHPIVFQAIVDRLIPIISFVTTFANANTQVLLTLGLEDNYSEKANWALSTFVKARWPWILIRNPLGHGKGKGAALFIERHGSGASCGGDAQVVSQDGSVMSAAQTAKWLKRNESCFAAFIWNGRSQGYVAGQKPKGPRKDRKFEFTSKDTQELSKVIREDGA